MQTKLKLLLYYYLPLLSLLFQSTVEIQLCANPSAPYPCTACQAYTNLNNGLCSCKDGYYMNTNDQPTEFCDLCHGSCRTCYGPLSTNCISCPSAFTFDNSTARCVQANSLTDQVISMSYYIQGFTVLTGWTFNAFSQNTYQCGVRTLLGGGASSGSYIQVSLSSLPNHFAIRVRANFFFLNANGVTKSAQIQVESTVAPNIDGSQTGLSFQTCSNTGDSYVTRAADVTVTHSGSTANIYFYNSAGVNFGIRDVIIIVQKCASNCTTCTGYLATNCTICADSNRLSTVFATGTCICAYDTYQQPYAGTCADPCPSVPIKYYGDNNTRTCVQNCPPGTFAHDDLMRCWGDCPSTSIRTLQNLYRDYTNRKCVTNCPSTQPYADPVDRKCYAVCPSPRFGTNVTTPICVSNCPHTYRDSGIYKTYASGRYCVPYCPSGTWANPATSSCVSPCTGTFALMDNSTGQNLCVSSCPPPNRFASSGSCIQICPPSQYGDTTTWACTTACTSPLWGLQSYNRKCVPFCPSGTWGRNTSSRTCVNTTSQCNPLFADDYTRQCVAANNCPYGTWAETTNYRCVSYCPNGTYGNPNTQTCQSGCPSPFFADPGVNLCLSDCVTEGLYSDVSSSRTCVPACNTAGLTPWADDSTRRCVNDCNNTVAKYLADNTTWKCVFDCPMDLVADFTTLAPKCVSTCPNTWYADNSSGTYRICVQKCQQNPPQFGDALAGNLCVDICTAGTFGDQTGNRLCGKTCPSPYFSQNDGLRRCVLKCNSTSFGYQQTCTFHATNCPYSYKRLCYQSPQSCPSDYFGDNSTNLCVNPCPSIQATFGNPFTKFCVLQCPNNTNYSPGSYRPVTLYADISNRQCVETCSSSYSPPLFGSNSTRTCEPKCLDYNAYAETQSTYRICVDRCWISPSFFYANNLTKTCGNYMNCPSNYYAQNSTQMCVETCPSPQWGYRDATRRMCLDICPPTFVGDDSTTKRICYARCPDIPDRYADLNTRICVDMCNLTLYGEPISRTCQLLCQPGYFSYQPTRRCIQSCPDGYFADDTPTIRKCQPSSSLCAPRFGDTFLRKCVPICTGPTPVNTFGSGTDCVTCNFRFYLVCPNGTYADSYTSTRLCVQYCPPGVLNSVAAPNLYGDPTTRTCVSKCITPNTWADYQTRLCQPICSASPTPTFSQNFQMTCVVAMSCPTLPTSLFGDSITRSCVSFCSNNTVGQPTNRLCVTQCLNTTQTGTSNYYADISTGQHLCVVICPTLPRLFGRNDTNKCVTTCPALTFGDQTGNRTCVPQCPLIGPTYYYAQNNSRICVLVCIDGTWGLQSSRQCVQYPTQCGTQWADNTTHLCVDTCPAISNLYGDPSTTLCVQVCPNTTFADDLTRTCVAQCPTNNGVHDTFGNNDTWICQQKCTQPNTYADPQTINRYCVLLCSQSPLQSFADPISKSCVATCPSTPSLFADVVLFKCVSACVSPYFADTHTRRCVFNCDSSTQFKLRDPRLCVTICPSLPDLYGDSGTGFCELSCSAGYRYGALRICVPLCTTYGLFDYNGTCVKFCPYTYYADSNGHCVNPCPSASLFGQNTTTTCLGTCITGYAYNRLCVAMCPNGLYGYNNVCQGSCPSGTASNATNLCIGTCDAGTYSQNAICVTNCTTNYADPNTRLCSPSCTLSRYADPSTRTCVQLCPVNSFRDPSFVCKTNCSPLRADNLTATCTNKCSNGTWGYNYQCVTICPPGFYGYTIDNDCYNIANIPDVTLFADNVTQTWVSICSYNPLKFGDTYSHECVTACTLATQYTDPVSRQCKTSCTSSSYYRDPTTKQCVLICPDNLNANYLSGSCQYNCTLGLFDYDITHSCVSSCPLPYYGYDNGTELVCVLVCLAPTFAQGNLCVTGCTLPLVADSVTRKCVMNCINSYASSDAIACIPAASCALYSTIADNSSNKCVPICPTDPDYYMQNGICVPYCSFGTYADPTAGLRICTSLCTQGLYGDPVSGRCVLNCLPGYYAFNDTNLCLTGCPNGFASNQTNVCLDICPSPTFADTLNNKCMKICTNGQFGEGNICVPTCTSPLLGNPLTMQCQSNCPSFDYTFAQNTTHKCVKNCSIVPNSYADRFNNYCMDHCSQPNQYALDGQAICTSLCPSGLYMQNSTKKCQPGCDTGYAQPTSRFCVARCFGNPQTFAHVNLKKCIFKCKSTTQDLYADNSTNFCVSVTNCSRSVGALGSYSDPISGQCVLFCPQGLYAQDTNYTCTSYCVIGFADNLTRRCVSVCPILEQTYGDPNSHTCVKVCPNGWFAKNSSQTCVPFNNCPTNSWSDIRSKHCVARCPSQPLFFGYDGTTSCVSVCPTVPDLYGDNVTQKCIWPCTNLNGQLRFADSTSRKCMLVCPISLGLYGDPTTGRCTSSCNPANPYKDNSTQRCVAVCPSNPDYYAHIPSFTCVRVCPSGLYASDPVTRICTSTCQSWLTFRDDTTHRCIPSCFEPYFADNYTYKCVSGCPTSPDYYADPHSRTCVFVCPIGPNDANGKPTWISWIQDVNRTCVTRCPPTYYAQNSSGRCVQQCPLNQYADPIIQVCVADCTVRPKYYKQMGQRVCVTDCPSLPVKSHRYQPTHLCVNMTGAVSGCPPPYYTNQLTNYCTTKCPTSFYADDYTRFCRLNCTNGQFADPYDRKCKTTCTHNPPSYAYTTTMTCIYFCPSPYFSQNVTYTCTSGCPNMTDGTVLYSYNITRQCVIYCPAPYYSYINTQQCLTGCPSGWYANDDTRTCTQTCTGDYNADDSTNRCVQTCPQNPNYFALSNVCTPSCPSPYFKDYSTRTCVTDCPYLPLTFADNTTNQCVTDCPPSPNYFADNFTRICVQQCSSGLFADPTTRTCVQSCPVGSNTFADPISGVCIPGCPAPNYASNLTQQCVPQCPNLPIKTYAQDVGRFCTTKCMNGLFGNNDTRTCQSSCLSLNNSYSDITTNMCVTTCPLGFYAYNATAECRRDCPGLYADSTTRRCVANCPGSQRLYADTTTNTCVLICPVGWFGDADTWTCRSSCVNASTGYVLQVERRCVVQCPSPYFGLTSQRLCVTNCGPGLYGDLVTRTCKVCPTTCRTCLSIDLCLSCTISLYLQYGLCVPSCTLTNQIANYANNNTMACGSALNCPAFNYGLNSSKSCQTSCPTQMYGNTTTKTCENCPATCLNCRNLTYCTACVSNSQLSTVDHMCYAHCSPTQQYYYGGNCVNVCPNGTFFDFTNVYCYDCNALCLTCQNSSLNCTSCSGTFLYANTCVTQCPSGYYGQSNVCIQCSNSSAGCSQPLTFSTSTSVQNYQQVIVIKFNQNTKITGKPQDFININLQMTRLLQDASAIINNGISFTSQVLSDGTIKLYLNTGLSLNNIKYSVSFTDPSKIQTQNGATLQNLQEVIALAKVQVYPDNVTYNAPLVVVGKILGIAVLFFVFLMLIVGLSPVYLLIQAIQMCSLFAYTQLLPPNLFYFLKQMRITRFLFIPNIFQSLYVNPTTFVSTIPQKIVDTQGQLSFSVNAAHYIYFVILFIIIAVFVYSFTTKINSNRPLKNLFIKIFQSRIKFEIINDFVWLFAINIFVQAFMQFRYITATGDFVFGILSAVVLLGVMLGLFGYGVKIYRSQSGEGQGYYRQNYGFMFQGMKSRGYHKFFGFLYYLKKLIFAIILTATIFNTLALASAMLALYSVLLLAILILRPYQQHLTNFVILANQGFQCFFCGGIIYYLKMIDRGDPSGAKITCGNVLTIVIIVHICLLIGWTLYKGYFYLKQLREQFKKSQFYLLYMDEEYDAILEKEISQLNQDGQGGEIQSIQITNVGNQNRDRDNQNQQQEDDIIRLKIKRRVKKQKLKNKVKTQSKQQDILNSQQRMVKSKNKPRAQKQLKLLKQQEQSKDNRTKADYIKIQKQNQNYYKLQPSKNNNQYQKLIFINNNTNKIEQQRKRNNKNINFIQQFQLDSQKQEEKQRDWVRLSKNQNNLSNDTKNKQLTNNDGSNNKQDYKRANADDLDNIFQPLQQSQAEILKQRQMQRQKYKMRLADKQRQKQKQREKQQQKLRKRADLDSMIQQMDGYGSQPKKQQQNKKQKFMHSFADFKQANIPSSIIQQPIKQQILTKNPQKPKKQLINFQKQSQQQQLLPIQSQPSQIKQKQPSQIINNKNQHIKQNNHINKQNEQSQEYVQMKQSQIFSSENEHNNDNKVVELERSQKQQGRVNEQSELQEQKKVDMNRNKVNQSNISNINDNNDISNNNNYQQLQSAKQSQPNIINNQPQQSNPRLQQSNLQQHSQYQPQTINKQPQNHKLLKSEQSQQQYKVFNFDQMNMSQQQQLQHMQQKQKQKQKQRSGKNNSNFDYDEHDDEQERKRKEKSKKMHLMLFEDQDQDL